MTVVTNAHLLFLSSTIHRFFQRHKHITKPTIMSYNILGSGYRPNITLFSFDSTSAKIHKVSDSKAPENASWLEPSSNGVIYSTSELPKGEVYSLKLQGEEVKITGKRSTKGEEPAHGEFEVMMSLSLRLIYSARTQGWVGCCHR
jgi:6-phosphogluconolactonase (cycloisomerase 2 family)